MAGYMILIHMMTVQAGHPKPSGVVRIEAVRRVVTAKETGQYRYNTPVQKLSLKVKQTNDNRQLTGSSPSASTMMPSTKGQVTGFSILQSGFKSRWHYHIPDGRSVSAAAS